MFDKITSRINKLCYGLNMEFVDPIEITQSIISGVYPGVTTVELDTLAAETCAYKTTSHPDYAILAARIAMANLHKETKKVFSEVKKNKKKTQIFYKFLKKWREITRKYFCSRAIFFLQKFLRE